MTDVPYTPALPKTGAGALFTDDLGRIMLVEPTYKPRWEIPGGAVEAGETPLEACQRELAEELGLRLTVGPLLVVDWAPHQDEDRVLFVFEGGRLDAAQHAAIRLQAEELRSYRYVEPDRLGELTSERMVRRLLAAAATQQAGQTTYLERGLPTGG